MKVPPDRRRFVTAREEKFRIQSPDEQQRIVDSGTAVLYTPPVVSVERATDTPANLKLPAEAPEPTARETTPPITRPSNLHQLRTWEVVPRARPFFTIRAAVLLTLAGLALGGLGGALLLGMGSHAAPPAGRGGIQEEVTLLTPADEDALDTAYADRHAGKFAPAEQLFDDLARQHPRWDAMKAEVGRTLFYEKNMSEAYATLRTAVDKGLAPAEANFLLGALAVMRKSYPEAEASLATAVALDPTRPDIYYLWGDCLRAEGKPQEAAAKFRSAMLRNQYETSDGLFRLKFWLSKIEADRENSDGINAEIDAALAQPHPPMEAFFAAAARDLKAGNAASAASHLACARERVEPIVFAVILRDPTFTQESSRPELAEFFLPAAPVSRVPAAPVGGSPSPAP